MFILLISSIPLSLITKTTEVEEYMVETLTHIKKYGKLFV